MQNNLFSGNVSMIRMENNGKWEKVDSIKGEEGGTKAFITIAENYKAKDGERKARFIPFCIYVPQNLSITVGQPISVQYTVCTYMKDGYSQLILQVNRLEVSSRKPKESTSNHTEDEYGFVPADEEYFN